MHKNIFLLRLASLAILLFAPIGDAVSRKGICSDTLDLFDCSGSAYRCLNGECIKRSSYCNGRNDCGDNSDENYCNEYNYYDCPSSMRRCPDSKKCIPSKWFCDDIDDCRGATDEMSCTLEEMIGTNVENVKFKALQWLEKQKKTQSATEMWGSSVDKAAVLLYLASNTWTIETNGSRIEMAYEVSIQLLSRLSQTKLQDIPSTDLASYVNGLLVTCLDPRKFHGLDIVHELRTRVDNRNHTHPYLLLSLCNAGETITELDKKKLVEAFWSKHRTFWTDTQAIVIMALACARNQPGNEVDSETMHELALELKQRQYRNGTIENLQTTALVMQALLSAEPDSDPDNFDETKALEQIMAKQKPDGSFGNFMNMYYVLPVLNCKSLVNISSDHCGVSIRDETSALEVLANRGGTKISVRYSLWIGKEKDLERELALRVPANMSFYGVMEMAAEIDSRYRFEYVVKNRKPYVNSLSGFQDDPERGKFWFFYTVVDGKATPSQESPADVTPKDNEHFVMWYRRGSWLD